MHADDDRAGPGIVTCHQARAESIRERVAAGLSLEDAEREAFAIYGPKRIGDELERLESSNQQQDAT